MYQYDTKVYVLQHRSHAASDRSAAAGNIAIIQMMKIIFMLIYAVGTLIRPLIMPQGTSFSPPIA
jgi:hypothetical protein